MSIFNELDYRKILKDRLFSLKKTDSRHSYRAMAEHIRVQPPYLTKILNGDAHMNQDQLYLASKYLSLDNTEIKYINLLLEFTRSTINERKDELMIQISAIQKKQLSTNVAREVRTLSDDQNKMYAYYIDPLNIIVHMALLIDRYRNNLKLMAQELFIKREKIESTILQLKNLGIISEGENGYNVQIDTVHLPANSPLCFHHQNLMRQFIISSLQNRNNSDNNYNLLLSFTADEKTRIKIQDEFLKFLKHANKLIKDAPSENIYQMNFDLFGWDSPGL